MIAIKKQTLRSITELLVVLMMCTPCELRSITWNVSWEEGGKRAIFDQEV